MNERMDFLERRRAGLGGSDVAAILGLIPNWQTPIDVYLSKVNPPEPEEDIPEHMHWGNVLEPAIAQEFQRQTGIRVERRNEAYVDGRHPFLIGNIDRYCVGERAVLECKSTNEYAKGEWGDSGTDHIPKHYICQCTHYMSVTGYHKCYLAVLIGGNKFRRYEIPYNERLANHIRQKCVDFWLNHVVEEIPPEPVNTSDVLKLYNAADLGPIEATEELVSTVENLKFIKDGIKTLKEKQQAAELEIKRFLGDHDSLVGEAGEILATWRSNESTRLDSKALKADSPETYAKYAKKTKQRRFLLK